MSGSAASPVDDDQVDTRASHDREIGIDREDRDCMREGVGRDEKVERLDGDSPSPEQVPELARLLPETRRLVELVTGVEQGKDPQALGSRAKATSELGDDRPAQRDLVGLEQPVHGVRQVAAPPEELDPGRGVDQDQRRVSARSSSKRTLPRNARSADRLARRSSSCRPSTIVGVIPLPVTRTAASSVSTGMLTVTLRSRDDMGSRVKVWSELVKHMVHED